MTTRLQKLYQRELPDARRRRARIAEISASLARTRAEVLLVDAELDEHLADVDRVAGIAAELPVYPDRLSKPRGTVTATIAGVDGSGAPPVLDADRRTYVTRNRALAQHLEATFPRLVSTLQSMRGDGLRSPAGGGGGRGKGTHSDPTFQQATAARSTDPAQRDLDRLEVIIREVNTLLEEANSIRLATLAPETFAAAKRDEGCENCARHGRFEEVLHYTNVDDRLERPMRLGRWCEDFVRKAGVLPVDWQVQDHHAGKRVLNKPAEATVAQLDVEHKVKVTLTTHHPRTGAAEAVGDVTRALERAGLDAVVKRTGKPRTIHPPAPLPDAAPAPEAAEQDDAA